MSDDLPFFRVVRGTPTPEELAALVGVVLSRSRSSVSAPEQAGSLWVRSARPGAVTLGGLPRPIGRDAWRASALPR
ncbi:MAG TPA: acyl-CoA carboxylase subunit epsilon [Micromonosporaceae bacterium]|nr:acyl-CoA carboxylase subunit epsilon [Micromonosporaceae bacterium]